MGMQCAICGKKPVLGNQYARRGKANHKEAPFPYRCCVSRKQKATDHGADCNGGFCDSKECGAGSGVILGESSNEKCGHETIHNRDRKLSDERKDGV